MIQDTQTTANKTERKYTVREVLDSLSFEEVDHDGDFDGYIHLTSDLDGSGTQINMSKLTTYGNARYDEGVKAERERVVDDNIHL